MMEGDSPELEIDSELVMSFYDQYQADDLACKVYGVDGVKTEHDAISILPAPLRSPPGPFSQHSGSGSGLCSVSASIIELKPANVSGSGLTCGPDVSSGHVSPCHVVGSGNSWNLPDLLVGLDGITARDTSSESSVSGDSPDTCSGHLPDGSPVSSNHLLTSTIPCISLPSLDLPDHNDSNQDPSRHPAQSVSPFYFDPGPSYPGRAGPTDSLLDSLGILGSGQTGGPSVKTELVTGCPSPPPQYTIVDSRVDTPITMDLSQLVSHHNIPAQFELSLSPKCEPLAAQTQTNSIPVSSSFSLSNITSLASVSIANIDPGLLGRVTQLQGATVPVSQLGPGALSLDLIAQHCTLLPPELVSLPPGIPGAPGTGLLAPATTFITQEQDIVNNNIADTGMDFTPVHIKEEEECVSPPLSGEVSPVTKGRGGAGPGGPVYKRCHLCVRIFSTKANLSSHIRHVHMGEAKHSRVKSIPCPHCNKMFSRKGHMTEHVRTVHEGKKRIYKEVNCQHCGKTFRRKWGLNIHISSAHADVINAVVKQ